jgi:hypothetical protein
LAAICARRSATVCCGLVQQLVQQLGQHDAAVEQARTRLVGDAQRVAEAPRGDEHGAVALALEQRVGGHRGAHLHAFRPLGRDRLAGRQAEQAPDALDRGVGVVLGVVGQQLERAQIALGRAADDVGEGAAAVDPELPGSGHAAEAYIARRDVA